MRFVVVMGGSCFVGPFTSQNPMSHNDAINGTAAALFDGLLRNAPASADVMFSPVSVQFTLGCLALGATGRTRKELLTLWQDDVSVVDSLHKVLTRQPKAVAAASSLWLRDAKGDTLDLSGRFGVDVLPITSADAVNAWCADKTRGGIVHALDDLGDAAFIIVNALHFKANWDEPFSRANTRPGVFHGGAGDVPCNMMLTHTGCTQFMHDAVPFVAVSIPYASDQYAVFILPEKQTDALPIAGGAVWQDAAARGTWRDCRLTCPRFKAQCPPGGVVPMLKGLGICGAFEPDCADFEPLGCGSPMFIGAFLHGATCTVNEEGTEAAAVTVAMAMEGCCGSPEERLPPLEVVLDRPFFIGIVDSPSGCPLLLGRVANPQFL